MLRLATIAVAVAIAAVMTPAFGQTAESAAPGHPAMGEDTAVIAAAIPEYDPDESWVETED